jgi:hypothetical protein
VQLHFSTGDTIAQGSSKRNLPFSGRMGTAKNAPHVEIRKCDLLRDKETPNGFPLPSAKVQLHFCRLAT